MTLNRLRLLGASVRAVRWVSLVSRPSARKPAHAAISPTSPIGLPGRSRNRSGHRQRHRREVDAIARRHGARIAKRLRGAAVLEVSGAALDALAQDPAVAHLSGDVPVRR